MSVALRNLKSGERVEKVIRRHWIVFVLVGLYAMIGVFTTIVLFAVLGFQVWVMLLLTVFWMFFALFLYVEWLNHELDMMVITNNRVVVVEQKSFLDRDVGECTLDKIQEAGIRATWLFANILDYGVLTLKTAGSTSNFDMRFCPQPMECGRYVNNIVDAYRDAHTFKDEKAMDQIQGQGAS